jgi:O-antigen/teichoic acid export membrane protein
MLRDRARIRSSVVQEADGHTTDSAVLDAGAGGSGMARRAAVGSAQLGTSLLVSWVLGLVGRLFVPNLLGRDRFGELALYESVAAMVMSVVGFGLGSYIQKEVAVRPDHAAEFATPLGRLRLGAGLLLSVGVASVFWAARDIEAGVVALLFCLAYLALTLGSTSQSFLSAIQHLGAASASGVVAKVVWFVVLIVGLAIEPLLVIVPAALLLSETLRTVWLGRSLHRYFQPDRHAPMGNALSVIKRSSPYYVNTLNVVFMTYSVPVILSAGAGVGATGLFSAAAVIQGIPLLFTPVMLSVLTPVLSKLRNLDEELMWSRVRALLDHILVPLAALGVVVFGMSELMVRLLLRKSEFTPAVAAFSWMGLAIPATYLAMMMACAFVCDDRGWQNTRINATTMLIVVTGVAAVAALADAPAGTVAAGAAAVLAAGEWITVAWLLLARWPGRMSAATTRKLVASVAGAVLIGVGRWGTELAWMRYAGVALAVVIAVTELPRLLRFVRTLMGER